VIMKYISTRGNSPQVGFIDAILAGLAPDGGLYVPKSWPRFDDETLAKIKDMPYSEVAALVLKAFAGDDLSLEVAQEVCKSAYNQQWHHQDIVPTREIAPKIHLMELFHGPSLAFKDVAMQMIGALFEYCLEQRNENLSVICATSGDTGGAAVEAFKDRKNIELFVLMPDGRVSEVQKRFMTASGGKNVHALVLDGDFDGAQSLLKGLFADKDFVKEVKLAPVNSVNFARIVAQSVYFLKTAQNLTNGDDIEFIVPTGNFGDALSGWVAKQLGAKIGMISIANNANNALANAMLSGHFEIGETSIATISPAMDIQIPSNFERVLYEIGQGDEIARAKNIVAIYQSLKANNSFDIAPEVIEKLAKQFNATSANDDITRIAVKDCYDKTKEVICPHTAVGWNGLQKLKSDSTKVLLATAHAAKFPETTIEILGINPHLPEFAKDLFDRPEHFEKLELNDIIIKNYIRNKI
jgi:threonine synthase